MALSSWMAKKFTRGMTNQWKAKDLANALEGGSYMSPFEIIY